MPRSKQLEPAEVDVIEELLAGRSLDEEQSREAMHSILAGEREPAWLAAFLVALRAKGEAVPEITGFARAMREHATVIPCRRRPVLDTCGTGGDGADSFNVSTASAFVVAAAGQPVAKHGNRAVSSRCGSADVLEALGANLSLDAASVARCVDEVGIGFLFAPALHGAMKHAAPVRRALGIRTVFNLLGPLTNPAAAEYQVLGVFSPQLLEPMARVLGRLGSQGALLVHGRDGLDELSVCAVNDARLLHADGRIESLEIDPADYGVGPHPASELAGGDAPRNAEILREIFEGRRSARTDIVGLNAGAALWTCGLTSELDAGVELALSTLESGAAAAKLDEFVSWTQGVGR